MLIDLIALYVLPLSHWDIKTKPADARDTEVYQQFYCNKQESNGVHCSHMYLDTMILGHITIEGLYFNLSRSLYQYY